MAREEKSVEKPIDPEKRGQRDTRSKRRNKESRSSGGRVGLRQRRSTPAVGVGIGNEEGTDMIIRIKRN